ncbi:dicarboxylate/amino acid:cation symporter [Cobetia marina]|uniref:dicarboxylate/amino acid:cation symporter n=1 Tax=Cobetia marina TaxID=28258 RepID=UPI001141BA31|nr:dicarboxylate/amino acid:cation symporter [Cobetia marina]GED41488.1 dicarboxylate:amino acid:cation symporter DAACS family protein [Cobetia marina]
MTLTLRGSRGLPVRIFIGFMLGISCGLLFQDFSMAIKPLGDAFINAIKMLIVPIIFFSVAGGIANMGDVQQLKRVGGKTLLVYVGMTLIAGIIGLVVASIIQPGKGLDVQMSAPVEAVSSGLDIGQFLLQMIPSNPVAAMASGNVIQLIVFTILVGVAMVMLGERVARLRALFDEGAAVSFRILDMVMATSPIGIFALMAYAVANYGIDIFGQIGKFILADYAALLVIWAVVSILLVLFTRISYPRLIRKMVPICLMTLSTTSSNATLPVTMKVTHRDLGVPEWLCSFMLPLGATINLMGAAAYLSVLVVFAADFYDLSLSFSQMVNVIFIGTILSMAAPGIPGGGIVMGTLILQLMNLPFELVGLIAGIYRIVDMGHTTLNVSGDVVGALLVAKSENLLSTEKVASPTTTPATPATSSTPAVSVD